jgi:hypothetical protein
MTGFKFSILAMVGLAKISEMSSDSSNYVAKSFWIKIKESRSRKIKFKQFNFDYAKTKIQHENQHLQPGNFW